MQPPQAHLPQTNNHLLIQASKAHNLPQIKRLLSLGANVNFIKSQGQNAWYSGNTTSPLYEALHSPIKTGQKNYVDVLEALLEAGANVKFQAQRGNWNHSTLFPLFSRISSKITSFKDKKEVSRFLNLFIKYGIDLNKVETHQRSKNLRGYCNKTCFIFQLMDSLNIRNKLDQLSKCSIDINKLKGDKENKIISDFQKQFPHLKFQQDNQEEAEEEVEEEAGEEAGEEAQEEQDSKIKDENISLIENLINSGVSPNSFRSDEHWENYKAANYQNEEDSNLYFSFDVQTNQQYETILHRAIANDIPRLVKLLIEKGAKTDAKCKYTTVTPQFPNDWPEIIKNRFETDKIKQIKSAEQEKAQLIEQVKNIENEDDKKDMEYQIKYAEFRIYKAKKSCLENQCPTPICTIKQVSCFELAQLFKVSDATLKLIKK